ncbi:50S ribosomal protein L20, partial [Streptococcus gordonii]
QPISNHASIVSMKLAEIEVNRKMLADLAVNDATAFTALADAAKAKLGK